MKLTFRFDELMGCAGIPASGSDELGVSDPYAETAFWYALGLAGVCHIVFAPDVSIFESALFVSKFAGV